MSLFNWVERVLERKSVSNVLLYYAEATTVIIRAKHELETGERHATRAGSNWKT